MDAKVIEELREKHRHRLVISAFRGKFFCAPDEEEFNRWANFLRMGGNLEQMLKEMSVHVPRMLRRPRQHLTRNSQRADVQIKVLQELSSLSDDRFVDALYDRILGRAPDPVGKQHFRGMLELHGDRRRIVDELKNSIEARSTLQPLGREFKREQTITDRQRILNPALGLLYYYVDHTINCPVNTGMQRVTRQLARALLSHGERIVFVKWSTQLNGLVLVNQLELNHLAQWGGPRIDAKETAEKGYPPGNDCEPVAVVVAGSSIHNRNWLIVPEVAHINFHGRQLTLEVILAAKRLHLRTAFVFYDAIPLRREELAGMAPTHEDYMRQLLQADAVLPISAWSAQELIGFLGHHERVAGKFLPAIAPLLLPAEVNGRERVTSTRHSISDGPRRILCVGSIDERKNQLCLVRAFVKLALEGTANGWQLDLIGNCNPGLHQELASLMEACPSVKWHGHSSDDDLKQAYTQCEFTVFPSVEEGFGLPIAESLWYGKPCLCANFGPMAEIAGGGGCLQIDTTDEEALSRGLSRLIQDNDLRGHLAGEATTRRLDTWIDYGFQFSETLATKSNPLSTLEIVYYVAGDTASYPHNSGIQRVVRALAASLIRQGVRLIAAKWNDEKTCLVPLAVKELQHLGKWNGPSADSWTAWIDPYPSTCNWVLLPELTPHYISEDYQRIRAYLDSTTMRGCWIFYDAIPWKLRDIYPPEAREGHRKYMLGINQFELILPISHYSREQLEIFYLGAPEATVDLAHRLLACPLPGEFQESPRNRITKPAHDGPINILSVGTLETRKNHLALVRAFLRAADTSNRPMYLTLAGGGPDQQIADQIEALISNHPIVKWIRHPSDADLSDFYAQCDFTVYPSYEEGFGLPILESLWHGRPCICMNAGAMAEVGEGGGCMLVDTTNEYELASAIHNLVNDAQQRQLLSFGAVERSFRTWDDYANDVALHMAEERRKVPPHAVVKELGSASSSNEVYNSFINIRKRPVLSICVSTYNRAKWLALSLAVLVRESAALTDKVEILVCDNTSTDATPEIVAPYLEKGIVRYHRNPENVGMLGNLRVTAQLARGMYIWVLGDDDLLTPGSVGRVLDVIESNSDLAMVYLNYSYTRDQSPVEFADLQQLFASAIPVADGGEDFRGLVKDVAVMNENFFTAIYCVVFERSHAILAYSQFTDGEPFSSLPTCVPTTNHVLHHMMDLPAYWLAEPQIVINLNVSWVRYAWRWILERFPEIFDTAVRYGAPSAQVDRWRENHIPSIEHFLKEILNDGSNITDHFEIARLITSIKHTFGYQQQKARLVELYADAARRHHPLTRRRIESIFVENTL